MRIVLALLAVIVLSTVVRAQDDLENLVWEASVKDLAAFALEFVRTYDHKPVLVRGFDQPVKRFFSEAKLEQVADTKLEPVHSDLFQIALRDQPWREDIDGHARNVLILLSSIEGYAMPRATIAFVDSEGEPGLDQNPASITAELEVAVIRALDKRFARVKP
jgi:hypothetical protein